MTADERRVVLGRFSGLYGVRGWLKIHSYTEPRDALGNYEEVSIFVDGAWRAATIAELRPQGKTIVARLGGVESRDFAEELVGADSGVERLRMPEPAGDEYYWADLVGLSVVHKDGRVLGEVKELIETGAHDVLVVGGEQEVLIPFVTGVYVKGVDLAAGRIDVDWEWD